MIIPILIFSIPIVAILSSSYLKLQKLKLENGSFPEDKELKRQLGKLIAENEAMQERLEKVEYLLLDQSKKSPSRNKVDLSDFEKEQIKLDDHDKWRY